MPEVSAEAALQQQVDVGVVLKCIVAVDDVE